MPRFSWAILAIALFTTSTARSALVDWSTLSWAAGSLSNSYDVDPSSPDNDATFTITGDTGQFTTALASGVQTPAITSDLTGGFPAGHMSLQLSVDFAASSQSVTVTIDFSNLYAFGVANVSFKLFDVDFRNSGGNSYQDLISGIYATSITGTLIAPTITGSANNTVAGSGINQTVTGTAQTADNSSAANATISFNTINIRSVTFTYSSTSAFADPTYQHIALDNISYSTVPEANNYWVGLFGCIVAMLSALKRSRK
jgi:hypothetical protein